MKYLGISAHDGVGKSSTAQLVAHALSGVILPLALPLKEQAAKHLNIPLEQLVRKPMPDYLRAYLRDYGWAMRQLHGEDYWVKMWEFSAQSAVWPLEDWICCDDLRHLNEYHHFDQSGGVVVSLERTVAEPPRLRDGSEIMYPPIISEIWDVRELVKANPHHLYLNTDDLTVEQTAWKILEFLRESGKAG
jgi:hypothetical protein